jgi:O-antigen ligase
MKNLIVLIFFNFLILGVEIDFSILVSNSEIVRPLFLFLMLLISLFLFKFKNIYNTKFNNVFFIFFSMYLIYISIQLIFSIPYVGKINSILGILICYLFSIQISYKFNYKTYIKSYIYIVFILTILSWLIFLFNSSYTLNPEEFFRFKGVFLHSQRFSMVLSIAIIFLLVSSGLFNNYFKFFILFVLIFTLFTTKTRANISFVFLIFLINFLETNKKYIFGFLILSIAILIGYFVFDFSFLNIYQRGEGEVADLSGRKNLWVQVWDNIPNHLFFGHGFGFFKTAPFTVFSWIPYQAHNMWLMLLYETGIIGTIIFHLFFIYSFFIAIKFKRRFKFSYLFYFLIFVFLSSLTGVLIGGLVTPFYFIFLIITFYEFNFLLNFKKK